MTFRKKQQLWVFALLISYLVNIQLCFAENPATPEPEILNFPRIIVNEVDFKNTEHDWIELYVVNDNNNDAGNSLKGLQIKDDSVFLTIQENLEVKTGDYILISFKESEDEFNLPTLKIKKSGLTGTTEQIILLNPNDEIIDAVCWVNDSPTESEIGDFEKISNETQWLPDDIKTCINSGQVNKNTSIGRITELDTNSQNDWDIFIDSTPGTENLVETETEIDVAEIEEVEETVIVDENICESEIFINEFLPNPSGTDSGNEWIELINSGEKTCSLKGWVIDDQEGGSKPYTILNREITTDGFLLLPSWETKLNLNNSEDSIRLIFSDDVIQEIEYQDAKENQTFAQNEDEFEWTSIMTPLLPNKFDIKTEPKEEKKEAEKKDKTSVKNGTLSDEIYITEVFPNPKGTDKGNEWVEIHNASTEKVDLSNWTLDSGADGKKSFKFENILIDSNDYFLVTKFSLANSGGKIRLVDFEQTEIDEIEYENSEEGKSFAKIFIENSEDHSWSWTNDITKKEENPTHYLFEGEIMEFNKEISELVLNIEEEATTIMVVQDGDALLTNIFQEGAILEVIVSKTSKGLYVLENYKILKQPDIQEESEDQTNSNWLYIILSSLPPAGMLGYVGVKKFGLIKILPFH